MELRRRILIGEIKGTSKNAQIRAQYGVGKAAALLVIPVAADGAIDGAIDGEDDSAATPEQAKQAVEPIRYEKKGFSFHKVGG